jgi:hypothetical protein
VRQRLVFESTAAGRDRIVVEGWAHASRWPGDAYFDLGIVEATPGSNVIDNNIEVQIAP